MEYFKVESYKAFQDEVKVDLKPITLLFGENNAGKSALARFLPSLFNAGKISCLKSDFLPVDLVNSAFGDLNFFHENSSKFSIEIGFSEDMAVRYVFYKDGDFAKVRQISFIDANDGYKKCEFEISSANNQEGHREFELDLGGTVVLNFFGIIPDIVDFKNNCSEKDYILGLFKTLKEYLICLERRVNWLGPLRAATKAMDRILISSERMSHSGYETGQILARDGELCEKVAEYFQGILKHKIKCETTGMGDYRMYSILVSASEGEKYLPISECGTGFGQILPILTLGCQALLGRLGDNPILIFESPELHLHDSIQDDLGDFFIDVANAESRPSVILESHSENLLLALQIKVAEKVFNNSNIIMNYLDKNEYGCTNIQVINFDEHGFASEEWGVDKFKTTSMLVRKLAKLYHTDES